MSCQVYIPMNKKKVKWNGKGSYNHISYYGVKIAWNKKLKINIAL